MKRLPKPASPIVTPFSFEGWEFEMPSLGVAEKRASVEDQLASKCEEDFSNGLVGAADRAKQYRKAAKWWRMLGGIPDETIKQLCTDSERQARDAIDVLLALAETKDGVFVHLSSILFQVQTGLHALAAHGNQQAANFLITHLFNAVDDFNLLASQKGKGKIFQSWATKSFGIPGIITPSGEKTADNARLVRKLKVGEKCPISIKGKWRFQNVANGWAMRLRSHIESERTFYKLHKTMSEHLKQPLPAWVEEAVKLKPFSSKTWGAWADLAWTIVMEATEGKPERHKALRPLGLSAEKKKPKFCMSLNPATIASNARAKIKERIRHSFKTIANG